MSHAHATDDAARWEDMWADGTCPEATSVHPYLATETAGLTPGTAIDAGCGGGREAIALAERGWQVTGIDVSPSALALARRRAADARVEIDWLHADLSTWAPAAPAGLVTTFYAHPPGSHLDFYRRLAGWLAVGGTLLIVGHLHRADHGHDHTGHHDTEPPEETTATAGQIVALLPPDDWRIDTALETSRTLTDSAGQERELHDVVVRATRLR
ncbi:trans-aconitate 2-methyltransferase [Gordonia sp. (in: high G+C Gram-positive bacteria)]|uniref:class I SAM-dependent methyltransferase n=1 Tax=Gordonia sp. (in: high G+C Gram-positive bacteria) TaxID=84139 RepID=UPI0035286451